MDKLLLKPEEVAGIIGVGRSRVYELLASHALPTVRIGNSIRVPADGLRAWIRENTESPKPTPASASEDSAT